MNSNFHVLTPIKTSWGIGFNFWGDEKPKQIQEKKKGLNLRFFLLAAVLSLSTHHSVWAEMSTIETRELKSPVIAQTVSHSVVRPKQGGGVYLREHEAPTVGNSIPEYDTEREFRSTSAFISRNVDASVIEGESPSLYGSTVIRDDLVYEAISNLKPAVKSLIGANGLSRLVEFTQYSSGWNGADSESLSAASVETFNNFFSEGKFRPSDVAVFMSSGGNVIANWYEESHLIEIEFESDGIQFFFAKDSEEGYVPVENFSNFKRRMTLAANALRYKHSERRTAVA